MTPGQLQDNPFRQPERSVFARQLKTVSELFDCYLKNSTAPLPSSNLVVTPEIRYQSELYLPISKVRSCFNLLFSHSLNHKPVFSSTPFHNALSWADLYCSLPPWAQLSPNPARFIEQLLPDPALLEKFIYFAFLPERFNGAGFCRYQAQYQYIAELLVKQVRNRRIRILDAACGSGEGSWELLSLAYSSGVAHDMIELEGWTLEPLEVFAARNQYLPHLPDRAADYRQFVKPLCESGWDNSVVFKVSDLLDFDVKAHDQLFDIVVCNGLIGGPIINHPSQVTKIIHTLLSQLAPEGILLIDNCFHDGWKKRLPTASLMKQLKLFGLNAKQIDNGIAATRFK
jgi:hypothetical protein